MPDLRKSFRLLRIFDIFQHLENGGIVRREDLAGEFDMSERSVQRDVQMVNEFLRQRMEGEEIRFNRARGGYEFHREGKKYLSNGELLSICKILIESRAFTKTELDSLLQRFLKSMVSQPVEKEIIQCINNEIFHYKNPAHGKADPDLLWKTEEAIHQHKVLAMTYEKQDGETVDRRVWPVGVLFSVYHFYLIAIIDTEKGHEDFERHGPAIYRFDRILEIADTGDSFDGNLTSRFKEGEYRNGIHYMYGGDLQQVVFRFYGPSPEAALDQIPTAKSKHMTDEEGKDFYEITALVRGNGILFWLESQGPRVEVLKPESLRERWIEDARKVAAFGDKK